MWFRILDSFLNGNLPCGLESVNDLNVSSHKSGSSSGFCSSSAGFSSAFSSPSYK